MTSNTKMTASEEKLLVNDLKEIKAKRDLNRRNFMAGVGLVGAAAGASLLSGCYDSGSTTALAAGPSQNDVLNFALNLEYLEATFYSYVTTGADLPASSITASGIITGMPGKLALTGTGSSLANDTLAEIAFDEVSHVADLRSVLGSAAVARPALNLAALGPVTLSNVIALARAFEDVGVSAYSGAANLLSGTNLTYAAQILGVEGFHAGVLRYIYLSFGMTGATKLDSRDVLPLDPGASAGAGPTTAGGIFATSGATNPPADVLPGFAYTRTTSQVLSIVYGTTTSGTTKGGFFPNGMNGNIITI
jgi:hypothetical protein